ncbi:MAG: DUF3164 family protein [Collimonas sp.]|uniref:DUF3164 family protein n=1 Tax=Collimonas sp. TaxID=1963772 RepID=UPI003266F19B
MNDITAIPDGYKRDAKGHLIPDSMIKPIDHTRDKLVAELVDKARAVSDTIATFKTSVFEDVAAFVQLSGEEYGVKRGGKKGNVTLHSFDGAIKISVASADNITFDERLQAAKALIDECIDEWSRESRPEIKVLVQGAFQADKEGNLNTGRILALRRLEISDPRWQRAMTAIAESVQVVGSKQYIRFYERVGDTDKYVPISLDIATA